MSAPSKPVLVIGDKNLSSWSLRPWLLLRHHGVDFEELRLPLDTPEFHSRIGTYSPTARVPVLHHGELVVWDSLAICEYVSETFLAGAGWPANAAARAVARAASAEMHSGFQAMRTQMPMNCRLRRTDFTVTPEVRRDVERVSAIWRECRSRFGAGGPFLFGAFSIADAMYAPPVLRLRSYGVDVGPVETDYMQSLLALPALREWLAAADVEKQAA